MMDDYSNRTLTAFFDDRASADAAVARLRQLGIADASVRVTGGDEYVGRDYEDKGFWESLSDFFFPSEDRAAYAEGLRRGGYLVTVTGLSADVYDQAVDILDAEGSVDLDERATSWREEGWASETAASTAGLTEAGGAYGGDAVPIASRDERFGAERGLETRAEDYRGTAAERIDEAIPVVEERLRVGKRDVNLGRVRVRSYVVEEPVSEEVRLLQERVEIERRPVDRALGADESAFVDRTIEAEEHAEEAVVSKEARVVEEIALRRESEERTETVSDSVRRTEVEVEDERGSVTRDVPRSEDDRRGS
jgi:uncharacterized protein (TIGR02271 family)